jgi:hypothetical protein
MPEKKLQNDNEDDIIYGLGEVDCFLPLSEYQENLFYSFEIYIEDTIPSFMTDFKAVMAKIEKSRKICDWDALNVHKFLSPRYRLPEVFKIILLLKIKFEKVKLGNFRPVPKLHKEKFSCRPIINYTKTISYYLCILIDTILRPFIMRSETYIKDSQNLIQKLEDMTFEKKPFLYSLDIVSLYTSIRTEHATQVITEFMSKYLDSFHLK